MPDDFPDPEQIENTILHTLTDFRNATTLEIGFGDGRMARHYRHETGWLIGVDVDEAELRLARDDYLKEGQRQADLAQADAGALPFAAASFDLVIFAWSL